MPCTHYLAIMSFVWRIIYWIDVEKTICYHCNEKTKEIHKYVGYNDAGEVVAWYWGCSKCREPMPHWMVDDPPSMETCGCRWCLKYFIWKKGFENIPPPRWVKMTRNRPLKECMMCYQEKTQGKWKCGQCRQYPCCEKCIEKFTVTCYRNCPLCRYEGQ